ncbi:MAG: hypothetical protein AAFV25_22305 [Bacteroidota bacterium]
MDTEKDSYDGKLWWHIAYSESQDCMDVYAPKFDHRAESPFWKLVEEYFGTMEDAAARANEIHREFRENQR